MIFARTFVLIAALVTTATGCTVDEAPSARAPIEPTTTSFTGGASTSTASAMPSLPPQDPARLQDDVIEAAWDNDVPRARRLIKAGADVNDKDDTQQSAYLIATSEGYLKLLELTLRHGADVGSLDSFRGTGLIRAADRGHAEIVGRLLQAGIDVDHVNNLGWTALHEAIILGDGGQRYLDTVRVLVAGGADVELVSERDGIAPIDHARAGCHETIAATLGAALARTPGPDPDASLLLAVTRGRLAVARLLVALGADPDALDDQHDTPWLVTGVTGSVPMLEILPRAGPDLTIRNRFGGISVIPASERGHVDYVRRVVRTGIDVNTSTTSDGPRFSRR